MKRSELKAGVVVAIEKASFSQLLANLQAAGYATIGPRVKEEAIVYAEINALEDLPQGYASEQDGGHYRLIDEEHERYFDITPGAQSWKQYLFPPRSTLFKLSRENGHWREELATQEAPKQAFIGVRGCEMAAIQTQDKVFLRDDFEDPIYAKARANSFILAVNCLRPGDTCFCTSMGTGPEVEDGFDLKLTELDDSFLLEIGSPEGSAVVAELDWEPITAETQAEAQKRIEKAKGTMGRELPDAEDIPALLLNNLEHPRWEEVGERCLSCTSCTLVCPTCFCWEVHDETEVTGQSTKRVRVWDSCFNPTYSRQAHGNTRPNTRSRYRQWLTHKLGTWQEQFGSSGCVGCGRCITWCPVGIDLTEEIQAMREVEETS